MRLLSRNSYRASRVIQLTERSWVPRFDLPFYILLLPTVFTGDMGWGLWSLRHDASALRLLATEDVESVSKYTILLEMAQRAMIGANTMDNLTILTPEQVELHTTSRRCQLVPR